MWKPPQRIRHELPVLRAPSAAEAARAMLFSPLTPRLGPRARASDRGCPRWCPGARPRRASSRDDVLDWYGRFADGEPGVIVVEATGIRDVPSGPLLRIGHDRFLPGLDGAGAHRPRSGAAGGRGSSSRSSTSSASGSARSRSATSAASSRSPTRTGRTSREQLGDEAWRAAIGGRGPAEAPRARRRDPRRRPRPARDRGAPLRLPRARHRRGLPAHPGPAPRPARPLRRRGGARARRRASTASSCTSRTRTRWRRSSRR